MDPLVSTWSFGACQSWTEEVPSVPDVIKGEECADSQRALYVQF